MAKKIVRGITDVKTITEQDFDTNNVNDLLSDGQYNYIHRKKGKSEEYHNLTDNIKTISSDNTDLLAVTNNNKTTNSATLHPKHDTQKEQVLESTRNTVTINHGANGTDEKTTVDTNPKKVLEHDNLIVGNGLTKQHTASNEQTTISLDENAMDVINNVVSSYGNIWDSSKQPPYDDLNTVPINSIVTYSNGENVKNTPSFVINGFTIITFTGLKNKDKVGAVQICFTPDGQVGYRMYWIIEGSTQWCEWIEKNEYPLGLELFENIAVIGDSYSSGELYPPSGVHDYYNISWIQLLARKHGLKATNYSRGGLQAKTWLTSEYGLQKMNQDTAKDLYFIYLGINDNTALSRGEIELGSVSDIGTENDTFYGNYSKIINSVKTKAPQAKIAIVNMNNGTQNNLYQHINTIADHFNLPVLDLSKDPLTSSTHFVTDMKDGHPQALGYGALATSIERLLTKSFNNKKTYWIDYTPQSTEE